jgi:hypothetical protein
MNIQSIPIKIFKPLGIFFIYYKNAIETLDGKSALRTYHVLHMS